ncbi:response regulator [Tepidiforma thermophila]|uniref:Two-component system nitrogen regulation response regulator GlnG n=1 Tax=Tepidiforma thermophila (strain KCTC 52669 / CGMCC 1.13589 / G233) TaxID=2761530 RepID=A0A2A9HDX6_TEPT2|nr:response regulator [Tepidiforma thermophila]PFG73543.1 two-component system nitrogen regulation response regulator GlnG [Tepidiforma thermophila]
MTGADTPARRILVIDDEPSVRSMLTRALAVWQFEAVAVPTAEEALARLRSGEQFACILLDLTMPGMGGEAALREIEALAPGTPVVLMSGYPRDDLARQGRHFLAKPFDLETLRTLLDRVGAA